MLLFLDSLVAVSGAWGRHVAVERGLTLMVGHYRRRLPAHRRMRQMIVDGELGTLIHLEVFFSIPTVHGSLVVQEKTCNRSAAPEKSGLFVSHVIVASGRKLAT